MLYIPFICIMAIVIGGGFIARNQLVVLVAAIVAVLGTIYSSITIIDNGEVGVVRVLGETTESELLPGLRVTAPWHDVLADVAVPRPFTYEGKVIASDKNPLTVSVGFAVKLNTALAWKVHQKVGINYFDNFVVPAGQTATRLGFANFPWDAAATSDRAAVEAAILKEYRNVVFQQFMSAGMTKEETEAALIIAPVQLRESLPDNKVLNSVAEKTAALQDLERQGTLTEIATKEAERRGQEGAGVKLLFDALPSGFTPEEIAEVLGALANKTRADSMLKAVESGQVDTVIMNGDTAGSVANTVGRKAVPTPPAANQ